MRADVKLGVLFSAGIVLAAGGYYLWRSPDDAPIELNNSKEPGTPAVEPAKAAQGEKAQAAQPNHRGGANRRARTTPTQPSANTNKGQRRIGAADTQRRTPTINRDTGRKPTPDAQNTSTMARIESAPDSPIVDPASRKSQNARASQRATSLEQPRHLNMADQAAGAAMNGTDKAERAKDELADVAQREANMSKVAARTDSTPNAQDANDGVRAGTPSPHGDWPRSARTLSARAPVSTPTAQQDAAVETHIVQRGDTLAGLAQRYYGSERYTDLLINGNPQLNNPSLLQIGATVQIPPSPEEYTVDQSAAPSRSAITPTGSQRTYKVREGDSFYAIARDQLGDASRWTELFELNKSRVNNNPQSLRVGQEIMLPVK